MMARLYRYWHYTFLLLFISFIIIGVINYLKTDTQIHNFRGSKVTNEIPPVSIYALEGQYRTEGQEFVVGDKINVYLKIYFKQDIFDSINKIYENPKIPKKVFVLNSRKPEDITKDLSRLSDDGEFYHISSGELDVVNINKNKRIIVLQGDIVFTKEGWMSFISSESEASDPVGFYLKRIGIGDIGVYVAPRYVKYQIITNKRVELLTYIAVAIAFLALFFNFYKRPNE